MKFQKVLAEFAGEEGEKADDPVDFLRYKALKKLLKTAAEEQKAALQPSETIQDGSTAIPDNTTVNAKTNLRTTPSERLFIETLQEDLKRINTYFMEQEEACIIKLQVLRDRQEQASAEKNEAASKAVHQALVNLHGELILLFHYSMVNYAGVMKILKKHDKLMGTKADRKRAYLRSLLKQPFTSTENISRLVKDAEKAIQDLSPPTHAEVVDQRPTKMNEASQEGSEKPSISSGNQKQIQEGRVVKRTRAALNMLQQLQQTAHTPSTLLPATETHVPNKKVSLAQ